MPWKGKTIYILAPLRYFKSKKMETTKKAVEDIRHVKGVAKKIQTTWRKIVPIKPNIQTVKRIILYFEKLAIYTKEKTVP